MKIGQLLAVLSQKHLVTTRLVPKSTEQTGQLKIHNWKGIFGLPEEYIIIN